MPMKIYNHNANRNSYNVKITFYLYKLMQQNLSIHVFTI